MKKLLLSIILVVVVFITSAQTQNLGNPPSWSITAKTNVVFETMPVVNLQEQLAIDALNKANGFDKTFRFGYEHHVTKNILELGTTLSDGLGGVITQYGIECPEALSVNLIFDVFTLVKGAELFIYNEEKTQYIGAHTSENNNIANVLGTDLIKGSKVIIELYEPAHIVGQSSLVLGTVVHGYVSLPELAEVVMKGLNDSGNCNVDVNCPEGDGWENQRNAVAMLVNGGGFCSGSLVNCVTNTVGDVTPYFLTANHCGTTNGSTGAFNATIFRFRWESPDNGVSCATTSNSANGPTTMTINGSMYRASDGNADFALVELNAEPDPAWGVYYNGYNVTDDAVGMAAGIHHPSGDIKKIAIEYQPLKKEIRDFNGTNDVDFWRVEDWDVGVTEQGSSGSPLFDANRRTIGVLSGGAAACNNTTDNNEFDVYGRLGIAWDAKSEINKQLKHWLDPDDTGKEILNGFEPLTGEVIDTYAGLEVEKDAALLSIYPNPSNGTFTIETSNTGEKSIVLINALGQTVKEVTTSNNKVTVDGSNLTPGIYIVTVQTENKKITKRLIIK